MAYPSLGCVFESQGGLLKAVELYQASINLLNSLRVLLKSENEWKVNFRNQYQKVLKNVLSNTVFQAVDKGDVNLWVVSEGKQVLLRQSY